MPKDDKTRQRLIKRNADVAHAYNQLVAKHPQWRQDALVTELADQFYLSETTVERILNGTYERNWNEDVIEIAHVPKSRKKPEAIEVQARLGFG